MKSTDKLSKFWENIKLLWFVLTTNDKEVKDDLKIANVNLKKQIELRKKINKTLKSLSPKEREKFKAISEMIPEQFQQGMYIASKKVEKQVQDERDLKDLYDKTDLVNDLVKILDKYIDSKIDLASKIYDKNHNVLKSNEITSQLREAFKVSHVEKEKTWMTEEEKSDKNKTIKRILSDNKEELDKNKKLKTILSQNVEEVN